MLGAPLGEVEEFDPVYLEIVLRSLRLAVTVVVVAFALCYPAAFWVSRFAGPRKSFVLFLVTLPFFANLIVRVYAWMLILRPTGFLNLVLETVGVIDAPLQIIFTEVSVVVGLVYVLLPFMFLPIYASVEKLDPALVQASQDLGATPWQTFRRVILPLTLPGIIGGSIIVFIPALGNFVVPALLGGAKVHDDRQHHRAAVPRGAQLALRRGALDADPGDRADADAAYVLRLSRARTARRGGKA